MQLGIIADRSTDTSMKGTTAATFSTLTTFSTTTTLSLPKNKIIGPKSISKYFFFSFQSLSPFKANMFSTNTPSFTLSLSRSLVLFPLLLRLALFLSRFHTHTLTHRCSHTHAHTPMLTHTHTRTHAQALVPLSLSFSTCLNRHGIEKGGVWFVE